MKNHNADAGYRALIAREGDDGTFEQEIVNRSIGDLPEYEVLIRVLYSSLNYKDALSATGHKGVTKQYPHTPGIDAAGTVRESADHRFTEGDEVVVTGYDLGQDTPGGFGQYIRVPADWIVPKPDNLSLRESMILGTAGFTAAYGVHILWHRQIRPGDGEILVTGATGGVGSLAISILAKAGFDIAGATGKTDRSAFLKELGAGRIIPRSELQDRPDKPLLPSRWAGAIETVGGGMLDTVIRETGHNGAVACCGNILGGELHTSIYPFILRGVSLVGIDSGNCPMSVRKTIWDRLSGDWKPDSLDMLAREVGLDSLDEEIKKILRGDQTGRILVNLKK